ncbi:MAG: ABC transporter permease [Desulfobacteraceae bacterium]|nr:ABC transporter permease [Desulfobacteraceae bacterium]
MARFFEYLITAWIIITANFFLPRLVPGDPLLYLTGEAGGDTAVVIDEAAREKLREYYELDRPLGRQYLNYLKGIFTADLGYSIHFRTSVFSLIRQTIPWTLFLVLTSVILSSGIGIFLGALSAWNRGRLTDKALMTLIMGTAAVPSFLLAVFLQIIFSIKSGIFPVSGAMTFYKDYAGFADKVLDILRHSALPVLTLTTVLLSENYLLVRNTMINILSADYIFVARMKGLPEWIVMCRHALRNALMPILTHASLRLGLAVGGMIFVETVFSYPGMGELMYRSVVTHDYPVTQGVFLVITITVLTVNFVIDLLYKRLDPRIVR